MGGFDWRSKLIARGHPRARISELHDKCLAKIVGRIIASGPMFESPIFHRTCVSYVVEGVSRGGRSDRVAVESELRDFIIDDQSGRALVQLRPNCLLMLEKYREAKNGLLRRKLPPEAMDFFRRHDVEPRGFSDHIHEFVLEPGQVVVVYGRADVLDAPGRGPYSEPAVTFSAREPLLITDDLGCGR